MSGTAPGLQVRAAVALRPLHGDEPCGDAAALHALPDGAWLAVIVDGLGHGPAAAAAAQAALRSIAQAPGEPLQVLLRRLHAALADTRGAAVGLLRLQHGRGEHLALGNTRTMRWRDGRLQPLYAQPGIVGAAGAAPPEVEALDLAAGDCVVMFTDGVDERLTLPAMLPEWRREPALLSEHLLGRFRNPRDDAGVLVLQLEAAR